MDKIVESGGVSVVGGLVHYGICTYPIANVTSVSVVSANNGAWFFGQLCWFVAFVELVFSALGLFSFVAGLLIAVLLCYIGYRVITVPAKRHYLQIGLASGEQVDLGQHLEQDSQLLKRAIEAASSKIVKLA